MWLSGQHKRPADPGEGATGLVTISGEGLAVQLESERRNLKLYSPGGYHWAPRVGQRVLVLKNQGEDPCVIALEEGESQPEKVTVQAEEVDLRGEIFINGIPLDEYILMVVAGGMG